MNTTRVCFSPHHLHTIKGQTPTLVHFGEKLKIEEINFDFQKSDKLCLTFPAGGKPDIAAAKEAFFKIAERNFTILPALQRSGSDWIFAVTPEAIKRRVSSLLDDFEELAISGDGDGVLYLRTSTATETTWIFFANKKYPDCQNMQLLGTLIDILQFTSVRKAMGGLLSVR